MSLIEYERSDVIAVLRLNQPEKLNALSPEMIREFSNLFANLNSQPDLRAIILTGTGDTFGAGIDMTELRGVDDAQALDVSELSHALYSQIENCDVPVIAAVGGVASGSGCELALACHLIVAADNAQFSLPEIMLGAIPGSTQRFARKTGEGRALQMMLTGRTVGAEEALRSGLINRVARAGELLAEAEDWAHEIAQLAPLAIRACLEAVTRGTQMSLKDGLALESQLFASLFATDDVREGTSAFLEKRIPVFRGI
jgi:enoyl-CoA hydratase